jgi:hypothetical protein
MEQSHNKVFQPEQILMSCLLLAQKPRHQTWAREHECYVSGSTESKPR